MNLNWQPMGRVTSGGTILDIGEGFEENLWSATSAGLFRKQADQWRPVSRGMSLTQVTSVLAVKKTLIAAGWPDGILYSTNNGRSWYKAWIDQIETSVNCLEISPNFAKDRVLLAGTQGKGILRSTDGGRYWQLSNFGLRGFTVYVLAGVGVKQTFRDFSYIKEIVFAATDDGVYQSPNGGRAWRPAGAKTSGLTVLSIALSQNFSKDQTIFAGAESGELFHSVNGGTTWQEIYLGQYSPGAINCLLLTKDGNLLVGTSHAGILLSADNGKTWKSVLSDVPPVIMLKQIGDQLYAGFPDDGLLISMDDGSTWNHDSEFAARRFQWLVSLSENEFAVAGPEEGIWTSSNSGKTWEISPGWPKERTVLGISGENDVILAASPEGIWYSLDLGENWSCGLEENFNVSPYYLVQSGNFAWGAGDNGQFWFSKNKGQNWVSIETDFSGNPVIGLSISANFSIDKTLVAGVRNLSLRSVQIWRSTDGGETWTLWHSINSEVKSLLMALDGEKGRRSLFGLQSQVARQTSDGWDLDTITSDEAPITSIEVIPNTDVRIVALAEQILYLSEGTEKQSPDSSIQGESIVAIKRVPKSDSSHTLFALTRNGMIWCCEI